MSLFAGLSADELSLFGSSNTIDLAYYTNLLTSSNTGSADFWDNIYPTIFTTNSALQGLANSTGLSPAIKQQLSGEAYFMRAFLYFYLVNLYGDVPLTTATNYTINETLSRTPKAQVWAQIIADLSEAQTLLSANYLQADALTAYPIASAQRVRPTKWAADAMLARAYLYTGNYSAAESMADSVINNVAFYSLDSLNNVFLANSTEAIWQLQPVNADQNTQDAILFVLPASGPDGMSYPVYLDTTFVDAFEPGDQRRVNWVDSVMASGTTYYYPFKYKVDSIGAPVSEYEMVLRLAEQYLIRAEARAQQGNIMGAQNDLNTLRTRAWLGDTPANDNNSLLTAIIHERQVELFTEWGHRWLDLKRTGNVSNVMSVVTPEKGNAAWSDYMQWYPIPLNDIQHDPNLAQNTGY
jgi:hypothetical protein